MLNSYLQKNFHTLAISVYSPERNEWIKKSDGSGATDIEPVKGGLSGALKRAASVLGIGRYLYTLEGKWVKIEPKGKFFVIQESEYKDLAVHYNQQMAARKKAQKAGNAPQKRLKRTQHLKLPRSRRKTPRALNSVW